MDVLLRKGDKMTKDKLNIIYEDKDILVVNKPAHLLTIATKDEKIETLYHKVYTYLKQKNKNNKVFIVHRLDRDTSGIVLFAKSEKVKKLYQESWDQLCVNREYIAIVEGYIKSEQGRIEEYLAETKTLLTYATTKDKGRLAITNYHCHYRQKSFSVLIVNIQTGRKNQIRVAMQDIRHPIIGDRKYGSSKNPLRRLCLHHVRLTIKNPLTNKIQEFVTPIPKEFKIFNI